MIEIQPNSVCPACWGTGRDFSLRHHTQLVCDFCDGRGWVPLATCKSCGRPAWKFWPANQKPIVRFCGKEECFTNLVRIHKSSKPVQLKGFIPVPVIDAINQANQRYSTDKLVETEMERYHLSLMSDTSGVGPRG